MRKIISSAALVLLVAGCASPEATVVDEGVLDGARGPFTTAEVDAVREFVEDDSRGSDPELVPTAFGVLALFEEEVVSFGVDPVGEAWRLQVSGPVDDASVGVSGESILLRYRDDLGPVTREQSMLLDARDGRVTESSTAWGAAPSGEAHLMSEVWATAEPEGILVARSFSDGDVVWQRDLSETCSSGNVDDVDVASAGIQLLVSYSCTEDDTARTVMIEESSGNTFWEELWSDAPAPRVHVVHEHTVAGGANDPIARMLNEGLSGRFLFIHGNKAEGVDSFLPEPWRSAPGVGDYMEEPVQDFETAPSEIVLHSSPRGHMHDFVLVQAARWLAEEESVPFSQDEIDDSLLIDGELAQSPRQWTTGAPGYISALTDELAVAFP